MPAAAQNQCTTHDRVLAFLAGRYQEAPVAAGITDKGRLIEVFATDDGATWTIVETNPQGWSCLMAGGEGWRSLEEALDPET